MGDRWGADGPPEEAYSRVTRDLDAVFAGLHDVARGLLDDLCAGHDVLRVPMTQWWVRDHLTGTAGPAEDLVAAWWLLPADPACLPAAVALRGRWDVRVRHGCFGEADAGPVGCGCDACDDDLDDAVEALGTLLGAMAGEHHEVVRPRGVLGRARWLSTRCRWDGGELGSGTLVEPGEPGARACPAGPTSPGRPGPGARPSDGPGPGRRRGPGAPARGARDRARPAPAVEIAVVRGPGALGRRITAISRPPAPPTRRPRDAAAAGPGRRPGPPSRRPPTRRGGDRPAP